MWALAVVPRLCAGLGVVSRLVRRSSAGADRPLLWLLSASRRVVVVVLAEGPCGVE